MQKNQNGPRVAGHIVVPWAKMATVPTIADQS